MNFLLTTSLFLYLLSFSNALTAQEFTPQQIAHELFYASGQLSQEKPTIELSTGLSRPTLADKSKHFIQLDKRALEICKNAPNGNSTNALASLLSQEIAAMYTETEGKEQYIESVFYGYMASFDPLAKEVEQSWTALYAAFPDLQESRPMETYKAWASEARTELDGYIPLFDMANYFAIVGKYSYSSMYYDKIKARFPSREIYSNAGVSKALQAIELFGIGELEYVYPFVLDLAFQAATKGAKEEREKLLMAATEDFKEAIRRDPEYAIAYVNLSCAQSLLSNYSDAISHAQEAKKLANQQGSLRTEGSALIALGIAYAKSGDNAQSEEAFSAAANMEDASVQELVKRNRGEAVPTEEENQFWEDEAIGEETAEDVANNFLYGGTDIPARHSVVVTDKLTIHVHDAENYSWVLQHDKGEDESLPMDDKNWFFQTCKTDYEGESVGEISIGAYRDDVLEAYGAPALVRRAGRSKLYFYRETGIIFRINEDDYVEAWTLFVEK
ncbi:MAG: hypothetical protein AAF587_00045 [Bacteroidota bacterium]